MKTKTCDQCGTVFTYVKEPERGERRFCSRLCRNAWVREHAVYQERSCAACGKLVKIYPSNAGRYRSERTFCSVDCRRSVVVGPEHPQYKGRYPNKQGYIKIRGDRVPAAYRSMCVRGDSVLEHRLIMATHLGRPLEHWEVVHHKNGVKDDNRIDNLELLGNHEHAGVSAVEHRHIATLRRSNKDLEAENAALRAQIVTLEARIRELEGG